jgi:hypothetical protein
MTEPTLKINQPNWYKVDVEKLHHQRLEDVAYLFATMNVSEDYEHFDKVKKFLIIPEKPKTLEEIKQELDEKFEELLVKTKRKFAVSKESAEYHHNRNFDRIVGNFEYAKTHGYFPKVTFISSGTLDYSNLSVTGGGNISSPCFMVKHGSSHQGYYTIGDDGYYKFYMEKKPNMIFRWFVYKLMGFRWVDEDL